MKYLHSHKIMNRDLTLANLMITMDMKVKIGDFDLATKIQTPSERHVCDSELYIYRGVITFSRLMSVTRCLMCLLCTLLVRKSPFDTAGVRSTWTQVVMGEYYLPDNLGLSMEELCEGLD